MTTQPIFEKEMEVRDYECDLQGIVNNANYMHYYEHTRHQFLLSKGVSFAEMHARNIDFVVARVNINYKKSLHSGERFLSQLWLERNGVRYTFVQKIFRLPDMQLCNLARTDCVAIVDGELATKCEEIESKLGIS